MCINKNLMQQGVNATGHESCVKILCNAQIASFQPALSYGPVFACVSLRVRVVCTVFFPCVCLCVSIHTMSHHLTYYVTSSYVCAFVFPYVCIQCAYACACMSYNMYLCANISFISINGCVYMYIHVDIHVHTHIHTYIHIFMYVYTYIHVCMYVCMYIYVYMYVIYVCM